jgi:WD40-like Beta Propeller Repeat
VFPIPIHALRSAPQVRRLRLVLSITCALLAATSVVACGGDSGDDGVAGVETDTTEASRPTEATPLGAGELIAFERVVPGAEERDLYVVGADGGEPKLLRNPGGYPHWSPDGNTLVFTACLNPPDCTTAVALLDRSTGEVRGHLMPDPELFTGCAIWAPSGKELGCEGGSEVDPRRNGVYTLRASDGKGLTRITGNPHGGIDGPLAYSPDGSQLLFARSKSASPTDQALFVTPISGGQPRRITPWGYTDDTACWSPDGRTIVFGTNGALYRVGADGQGLAEIALRLPDGSSPQIAFDVCFSPGGERIVFSLGSPDPGLYTARADGGDVMKLTDSPAEDHHANWGAAPGS